MVQRLVLALSIACVARASAQIGEVRTNPTAETPTNWVSLSVGIQMGYNVFDAPTSSEWNYPSGEQFALSLEHNVSKDFAVGVMAGLATTPATYIPPVSATNVPESCSPQCIALNAQRQFLGTVHYGSGYGLHFVATGDGGVTQFYDFHTQDTGDALPQPTRTYWTVGIGAGVGYAMSPKITLDLTEEYQLMIPSVSSSSGTAGQANSPSFTCTRVTFRIGF